jgi:DNA-directed RNA polymerase specialized sigma24 family protein
MLLEDLKSVKTYSPEEIAKKHSVSLDRIMSQLKKGMTVEKEHTTNKSQAREIA